MIVLGFHRQNFSFCPQTAGMKSIGALGIVLAVAGIFAAAGCAEKPVPPAGETFRDCADCPEMVVVPAGSFMMGSPANEEGRKRNEGPQHPVRIQNPFAVGKYEVTFAEWDAGVAAGGVAGHRRSDPGWGRRGPDDEGWGRGRRPAIKISWHEAKAYVAWLSKKTDKPYRLLSEAEWEYVARAGTATARPWGEAVDRNHANCDGCGSSFDDDRSAPVGSFAANRFGLHDVLGNVWEWVEDCWNGSYSGAPSDGSAWTSGECNRRVHRGGSTFNYSVNVRSAKRARLTAVNRGYGGGFRVAKTLER